MRRFLGVLILLVCFFSLPAFAEEDQPRYAFFPEFFSGNGWICEMFFTNQDIIGVPGITERANNWGPFDLPAAHIFKIKNGKIYDIEAIGYIEKHGIKNGWE